MNKTEIISRVSAESGVNATDCEKVLKSFEKVLDDKLSESPSASSVFDKVYRMMSYIHNKKN